MRPLVPPAPPGPGPSSVGAPFVGVTKSFVPKRLVPFLDLM
jgi:hypothetical protein